MLSPDFAALLGPEFAEAFAKKGYATLTTVQQAVLDPKLADRDLRISSQTGSGKTLAIGFALRQIVGPSSKPPKGIARPTGLVVTPTRELAKQVEAELTWLYAARQARVAGVTGGASYRDEHRALAAGPSIVVGTPGRLLDHLRRGSIDASQLGAVVLDEADRMLDLGFRDELEAILAMAPEGHRTHLVSATFAPEVRALADRVQKSAARVEGTPLGTANTDIDHIVHLVVPSQRVGALINLLLSKPEDQTLVFARTRADVARIADELKAAGFSVDSLSGEMEQNARQRALSAFKRGDIQALVATDVAARGIDVQDIARVVQMDPPTDADTYTHRSGRTGRAGRKGTSSILVAPAGLARVSQVLRRAGVKFRTEPVPTAADIRNKSDERLLSELTSSEDAPTDERALGLARRILAAAEPERALARLLSRVQGSGRGEPRDVTLVASRGGGEGEGKERPRTRAMDRDSRAERSGPPGQSGDWVPFRISWGEAQGADARRLLAMSCRRGGIRGADIGAIHLMPSFSIVDVAASVALAFETATREPDPRDPRVSIRRDAAAPESQRPQRTGGAAERRPTPAYRREARESSSVQEPPRAERRMSPERHQEAPPAEPRAEAARAERRVVAPRAERRPEESHAQRPRAERRPDGPRAEGPRAEGPRAEGPRTEYRAEGPRPERRVRPVMRQDETPHRARTSAIRDAGGPRPSHANSAPRVDKRGRAEPPREATQRSEPPLRPRTARIVSFPVRPKRTSADAPPTRKPRRS